ncbi:MAG: chemotaxis response regulator protein-glutamate methylesterase [Dehalococcoidia bacterium]|nr:chemotaxis response regulator protein-glutamate methylesterase [Dehalococcoidia bacterium]
MSNSISVLIVDDSAFARFAISKQIGAHPEMKVIGTARDGIDALEKIKQLKPDVVTLDVEMPKMDGLAVLKHVMSEYPTPVIMLSSLTSEGAETTLKALDMGAVDFFLKPSSAAPAGLSPEMVNDLVTKIRMAAKTDVSRMKTIATVPRKSQAMEKKARKPRASIQNKVIVLGCSTGGPRALHRVIPSLPGDLPAAMLVVQHMPPGFTKSLANRLNDLSEVEVREAQEGDALKPGLVLLAPGGSHMTVNEGGRVSLNQGPMECGLRPAANVTMESVAKAYQKTALGVVLTGMGNDGTRGAGLIKKFGGEVVVEDESTCVVYGMPKSIVDAGYADRVLPLSQIAGEITKRCHVNLEMALEV